MNRGALPALGLAVTALACGGGGGPTRPASEARPRIDSVDLAPWSVLSGTFTVRVAATGADSVLLIVDDRRTDGAPASPYALRCDTRGLRNGPHRARLWAGNAAGTTDTTIVFLTENPGMGIGLAVEPLAATVTFGDTVRFTALVVGTDDHRVRWSVRDRVPPHAPAPPPAAPPYPGSVDDGGLYRAPLTDLEERWIQVRAVAATDTAVQGEARVYLAAPPTVPLTRSGPGFAPGPGSGAGGKGAQHGPALQVPAAPPLRRWPKPGLRLSD